MKNKTIKKRVTTKDLIIGYGQIGKAIEKCYPKKSDIKHIDINEEFYKIPINFMHICFDCVDQREFIKNVVEYFKIYYPKHIVIHASIHPGTSEEIYTKIKKESFWLDDVTYSPCVGKHPDLYPSIKKHFFKFHSTFPVQNKNVEKLFNKLFHKTYYTDNIEQLEFTKLMSTTKYAQDIARAAEIKRLCDKYGYDYEFVNTVWDLSYNTGYSEMDMQKFIRPTLTPPESKIGGHCILANIKKLKESGVRSWILKIKPKWLIK